MQTREFVTVGARAVDFLAKARMAVGLALLTAGVLIAVFPQILVILLASIVVSAGLGTFLSGWRMHGRARSATQVVDSRRVHEVSDF